MKNSFLLAILLYPLLVHGQSDTNYQKLCSYMTGTFSSELQSKQDTDYFDIRLQMQHIWKHRTDGYWIYVEQAVADYVNKPYRQRIYQVVQTGDNMFESRVYEFDNPLQYAGAWNDTAKLNSLTIEELQLRNGCTITLIWNDTLQKFTGATADKNCSSNLRGAAYATSEVIIDEEKLISWDRGWDSNSKQVWGAEKGGYIFLKQNK